MEADRRWIGAAVVGVAFAAGITLALALRPQRLGSLGVSDPAVTPREAVALPLAPPVPPPQLDAAEANRPRGEIATAPAPAPEQVANTLAPPAPVVVPPTPAPPAAPPAVARAVVAAAPAVAAAPPTPPAPPERVVSPRPPAGAPTVRVSFLAWSRTPERRTVALAIAGGGLTTLHEGESADGIDVVEILPDGVRYRLNDGDRIFTARARD